jgi:hypothetical protein
MGAAIGLVLMVYRTQKLLWEMDMKHKNARLEARVDTLVHD